MSRRDSTTCAVLSAPACSRSRRAGRTPAALVFAHALTDVHVRPVARANSRADINYVFQSFAATPVPSGQAFAPPRHPREFDPPAARGCAAYRMAWAGVGEDAQRCRVFGHLRATLRIRRARCRFIRYQRRIGSPLPARN